MRKVRIPFIVLVLGAILLPSLLLAQKKDRIDEDDLSDELRELIENLVEDSETEFGFDYLFDKLTQYKKRPLNLNKASKDELEELALLTSLQINNLQEHIATNGELVTLYELQSIQGFDNQTIKSILPFVKVSGELDTYRVPVFQMLHKGDNELAFRYARILEKQDGYRPVEEGDSTRYLGSPDRLYLRYKHQYDNRHSWGFTAEKDAGEEFFKGSNKKGFDYYSAHLYYRNLNKTVKAIALGDYSVSLGQGLMAGAGFGVGKSSYVMNIKKTGRILRPYTSINEYFFRRGAAAHLALGEHFEFVAFSSYRKFDARALEVDTTDLDSDILTVSSTITTGLHRLPTEIERRRVLPVLEMGGSLRFPFKPGHIAINYSHLKLSGVLNRNILPYNQFSALDNESEWFNVGVDYSFIFQNLNFFGETAVSRNGGVATLNGLLAGIDRNVSFGILQRHYQRNYIGLQTNGFAESSTINNESGLYLGIEVKPFSRWTFAGYMDAYKHPWLRFATDAPSGGFDYLFRINYRIKRKMEAYIRFRDEIKQRNLPENTSNLDQLVKQRRTQVRIHLANTLNKEWQLRNRLDLNFFDDGTGVWSKGFMIYQDVIYTPQDFPISIKGRFAIFDVESSNVRIYTYENNVIGGFSIPSFGDRGLRYYLNLRYKGIRNLSFEFRIAQTYYSNLEEIGSNKYETIQGKKRTELVAQVRYKF